MGVSTEYHEKENYFYNNYGYNILYLYNKIYYYTTCCAQPILYIILRTKQVTRICLLPAHSISDV